MKPLISIFTGLTIGAAINTLVVILLDQKLMIGPFVGVTVTLAGISLAVKYVDWRLRQNLLGLLRSLESQPVGEDGYQRVIELEAEISDGLSLAIAGQRVGALANEFNLDAPIESPHV